jgi:hypothetical protein
MRPGITWMIVGAVAVIVVFAGLDALRSAGGEPTPSDASATTVTTTRTETGAEIESSASLVDEQLVRLIPGRVRTDRDWPAFDSFTVPPGWYGHQRGASYVIGNELKDQAVTWRWGGVSVEPLANRFSRSLTDAAGALEKLRDIRIEHVSPIHIGGNSGRKYVLALDKSVPRPLGANAMLGPGGADVILMDVPGRETNTLIIRWGFNDDRERVEVERVLMSLTFHRPASPEQEIAQTAIAWARLFAGDRGGAAPATCEYMTQPGCERINCERVGGRPIANCTPPSLAFRSSFADATVEVVAIEGEQASVRFTNGKVVLLVNVGAGVWWIHKFAGGGSARSS